LNRIVPISILEVPIANYLLNFNSKLVYCLDFRIIGLKLVKVNALKYLKVVLFRRNEGTEKNRHLVKGIVQSIRRRRGTADRRIRLLNRLKYGFCWFLQLLQLD
jgi:hypothetical protein